MLEGPGSSVSLPVPPQDLGRIPRSMPCIDTLRLCRRQALMSFLGLSCPGPNQYMTHSLLWPPWPFQSPPPPACCGWNQVFGSHLLQGWPPLSLWMRCQEACLRWSMMPKTQQAPGPDPRWPRLWSGQRRTCQSHQIVTYSPWGRIHLAKILLWSLWVCQGRYQRPGSSFRRRPFRTCMLPPLSCSQVLSTGNLLGLDRAGYLVDQDQQLSHRRISQAPRLSAPQSGPVDGGHPRSLPPLLEWPVQLLRACTGCPMNGLEYLSAPLNWACSRWSAFQWTWYLWRPAHPT